MSHDSSNTETFPRIDELDLLLLEITTKCNLKCVHCYADSGPELPLTRGMTQERWLEVLREAFAVGCRRVQFIGGEPTLHPDLLRLVGYAKEIGYKVIEVYTNGTVLDDRMLEYFYTHEVNLAFSVYGSIPATHDAVTERPGSFKSTIRNIRRSLELGLSVRATIVRMEQNAHDVEAAEEMLKSMGVKSVGVDRLRGIGRGNVTLGIEDPMLEMCRDCGRGQLAVDSEGNVFPCVFSKYYNLGHVSDGLSTLLEAQPLRYFRSRMRARE
jgi:MoaA/NifB/PqqE/SkfB family radical SAM enzyme